MKYTSYSTDEERRRAALESLGRSVRRRRLGRGLTLGALSERARVSERFLIQIEAGRGNVSVGRLCDVADALGTTPSELLKDVRPGGPGFVALLGLRGAGKSTVGRQLAARLGVRFVELDERVEGAAGLTLGEIFELWGEAAYREIERDALRRLFEERGPAVIATGGSLVTDPASFDLVSANAVTAWLKAEPGDHMDRVRAQGDVRPMLNRANAMAELRALLREREPLYARADVTVDTSALGARGSVDALVERLGGLLTT